MAELLLDAILDSGLGVICKMTSDDGDFRHTWDPADPESVENARAMFEDLRRGGRYSFYKIEGRGLRRRREAITEFDPAEGAVQVVAHRASRGG